MLQPRLRTLAITLSAIALFVGIGGAALTNAVRTLTGLAEADRILSYALIANIAIIVIGWRRYNRLSRELSRRIAGEQEARKLADCDPLTGCCNRRSFLPALDNELAAGTAADNRLILLLIDLDNFKQVNDRHGHAAGDRVLVEVARRLRELQPTNSVIARLGGDEFACAVVMPEPCRDAADDLARRLIDAVARPIAAHEPGIVINLTMSVGLVAAERDRDGGTAPGAEALLNQADIAMYRAKREGKNRFLWFRPEMQADLDQSRSLERDIRTALAAGEFVPFYEQQVDLQSGEPVGFQVLPRWQSPTRADVPPGIFIPLAEEIGLIAELSESLISQAFRDAGEWDAELTLSVNISSAQLRDPWFAQRILKLLVQHNFSPARLHIGISEACLHDNLDEAQATIFSLRNQGVKVSLDDIGAGHADLHGLRGLTFDRLKIDRGLVSGIQDSAAKRTMVDAIVALASALNLPVTAEGVDSETILAALKERGRLKGQGQHYGSPESGEAVRRRLQRLGRLRQPEQQRQLPGNPAQGAADPANQSTVARTGT